MTVTTTCPLADPRNPEYSIWCRHDNISNLQLGGEGYVVLGSLGIRRQSIVLLCPPPIHAQTQLRFECSQSRSHHHDCPHSRVVEEGGGSVECATLPQKQRHLSLSQQVCQLVKASRKPLGSLISDCLFALTAFHASCGLQCCAGYCVLNCTVRGTHRSLVQSSPCSTAWCITVSVN